MPAKQLQLIDLTGIELIDDQHGQILDLVRALAAISDVHDHPQATALVDRIVSLTLSHFSFEEELMEQAGYPFLKVHRRLHDHFIQRLAGYTQRYDAGEHVLPELVTFMDEWLHNHFSQEDRDYSPHILAEIGGNVDRSSRASNEGWWRRLTHGAGHGRG